MPPERVYTYGLEAPPSAPPAEQPDGAPTAPEPPPPASFGELALLYSKPRAATVVARTDGWLWSLSREDFRAALQAVVASGGAGRDVAPLVKALRGVEVLQCLSGSQLATVAAAMQEVREPLGRDLFWLCGGGARRRWRRGGRGECQAAAVLVSPSPWWWWRAMACARRPRTPRARPSSARARRATTSTWCTKERCVQRRGRSVGWGGAGRRALSSGPPAHRAA